MVVISSSDRLGSLEKVPIDGSALQGGIVRLATCRWIDRAQGLALSYVTSDIGAICPGRWHAAQCFWKMGATSRLNVAGSEAVGGAALGC
jgi:hypothetical protein